VAYEIELPLESRIHLVFHVSQLKPKLGSAVVTLPKLLPVDTRGVLQPEPMEVVSFCVGCILLDKITSM